MIPMISSVSNPKIKWVKSLHKNSTRRKDGVFLVEGAKEIAMALDGGYLLHTLFMCPEISEQGSVSSIASRSAPDVYTISRVCFEKISYRSGSDGLLAVFQAKDRALSELNFSDNPFFIVVESVEKPGNLGAIIRTADGCGADAVIVCDEKADIYNPNVVRSSVGTMFTTQIATTDSQSLIDFLQQHEVSAFGTVLSDKSRLYTNADFTRPLALILGNEHEGLSEFWQDNSEPIMIPMNGVNDSLNVSNAAAILAYEVVRQRNQS